MALFMKRHRASIAKLIITSLLIAPCVIADDGVSYAPDHYGEMSITYRPLLCTQAPCPPGHYRIETLDGEVIRATTLVLDIDDQITHYRGQYLGIMDFVGGVWVGGDDAIDKNGVPLPADVVSIKIARINRPAR